MKRLSAEQQWAIVLLAVLVLLIGFAIFRTRSSESAPSPAYEQLCPGEHPALC